MPATEIKVLLDRFIRYATDAGEKKDESLLQLCDQILCAYHDVRFTFDESDYPDAPSGEPSERRTMIAALFPSYGFYCLASSRDGEFESGAMVGDAIDDLADIACDFEEVLWRFAHTSVDDALWRLDLGYRTHWGYHMRSLQLFLFRRVAGV